MRPYDDRIGLIGLKGTVAGGGDRRRHIYGFHIDSGESDPSAAVTYLEDAVGADPAYMDYVNDHFVWGSWRDAFFLPRPCMLKYDGSVDYYLDPNDYTKKANGSASDVADVTYGGNAMMEWGRDGKKIWYKIVPDTNDNTSASVYVANYQADEDFHAWSFINNQGHMVDHFYTPIYAGSLDTNGRLRSLSGIAGDNIQLYKTAAEEVTAAEMNNPSTDKLWYIETWADTTLMLILLILMSKSLDTQGKFGHGRYGIQLGTGTMDDKGLFWGSNGIDYGVKVFGQENFWSNQWHRTAGCVIIERALRVKLTRGTEDGSTAADYVVSDTGSDYAGYLDAGITVPSSNNFVSKMTFKESFFMATAVSGSASTFWCDKFYQNTGSRILLRGGSSGSDSAGGAFAFSISLAASSVDASYCAAPSCKPHA